jgi:hypothetical protein
MRNNYRQEITIKTNFSGIESESNLLYLDKEIYRDKNKL